MNHADIPDVEDDVLVRAAQADPSHFDILFEKYYRAIYTYSLFHLNQNHELAEDLTQETFAHALQALPHYSPRHASYRSFLFRIAHNLLVNYFRSRQPVPLENADSIPGPGIQEAIEADLRASTIRIALQHLDAFERNIILLYYQQGLSIREIAHILNRSENAAKLLLSRTRKKLSHDPRLEELAKG